MNDGNFTVNNDNSNDKKKRKQKPSPQREAFDRKLRIRDAASELLEALEWMQREYITVLEGKGYAAEIIEDLPHVQASRQAIFKALGK